MKNILIIIFCLFALNVAIAEEVPQPKLQASKNIKINNINDPYYLKYYTVDKENIKFYFNPLDKKKIKNLNKLDKKRYKEIVKIEKLLNKGALYNAQTYDNKYLPTIAASYHYFEKKNEIQKANNCLLYFLKNDNSNIIPSEWISYKIAENYYILGDYNNAKQYFSPILDIVENSDKWEQESFSLFAVIADINLNLGNYNDAIKYAKLIPSSSTSTNLANETLYKSYYHLNNIPEAKKYAEVLYNSKYPNLYDASLRMANVIENNDLKMKYYNIAKQNAHEDIEISLVNSLINNIDNKKIEFKSKSINGFFKKPSWDDIIKNDYKLMSIKYENDRFNDYHNNLNSCFKYSGNDLKACYADLIHKQEKISQDLKESMQEYRRQLAEQERIRQLQLMNANIMEQNSLIQQQNYQLSRPRYYNSTTTQYGNTYYTNSYSY